MLGRKDYTREELDHAKAAMKQQVAAYKSLAKAATEAKGPLEKFEPLFFANLTLALDRYFVHRIRPVSGKDCNPLTEMELLADSLMNNNGVLRGNKVIKYAPEDSVLGLAIGDEISLTQKDFETFAAAFFTDLEAKFV